MQEYTDNVYTLYYLGYLIPINFAFIMQNSLPKKEMGDTGYIKKILPSLFLCVTDRFGSYSPNFHFSVEYPAHRIVLQILNLRIPSFFHENECFGIFMTANQNREHIVLEKGNSWNHKFVEKCPNLIIVCIWKSLVSFYVKLRGG